MASFKFDQTGTADYVTMGDMSILDGLSEMSCECWVNSVSFANDGGYNGKYDGFGNIATTYYWYDGTTTTFQTYVQGAVNEWAYASCTHGMSTNTWYHIIWTWSSSRTATDRGFEIYINGVKQAISGGGDSGIFPSTLNSGTAPIILGNVNTSTTFDADKYLAYWKFYNRSLTQAEVLNQYLSQLPLKGMIFNAQCNGISVKDLQTGTAGTANGSAAANALGPPVYFDVGVI